ncbi:phospho-N-acetylmuramoyl-pentapeptide-transferase [Haloglycomyces albus]|uniref:phospho-N-acetylmuramoyl-pentapeptide- transferase n=1 Tax=Haloglycomyces albus TaxID=526067 RepID=UPI00046D8A37|nr:phospho-N-acetylmuramoyl-pentapeptide-transferase [Haloglycomyces albus]
MRAVILAAFAAFALTMVLTPWAAKAFRRLKAGQPIRTDGPQTHLTKSGTPTMGGVVIIVTAILAFLLGHVVLMALPDANTFERPRGITATGAVLVGIFALAGFVGFLDDWLKIRKKNSGGISGRAKIAGLSLSAAGVGAFGAYYTGSVGQTVFSPYLSFTQDITWLPVTKIGIVVLFVFIVNAAGNGANLTDGLDGLLTGTSIMVFSAYLVVGFWQYRHWCGSPDGVLNQSYCYDVRDPLEVALVAGAVAGALFGFLWWNTSPATIFMGDSGSLALGALIAGMAFATKTIFLLPIIGALFVIETMSRIIQFTSFRLTGRRVFRMAPIHHHFELAGWSEVNVVVRFWIIAGIGIAMGLGFFFADFLRVAG